MAQDPVEPKNGQVWLKVPEYVLRFHANGQTRSIVPGTTNLMSPLIGFGEYISFVTLLALGIADNSIDAVISNCVINLSPNKEAVFAEIFRVLKPGGELHFSDVFASRRVPQHLKDDPELYGECLSGALYAEDFRRIMQRLGCLDHRIVKKSKIQMLNAEVEQRVGNIDFFSVTVRAFKLESLEDICENYGQTATYLGTIPDHPHSFQLDDHHIFETGKPMLVCGNTAAMVGETRYAKHFRLIGDRSTHFGPFDCGDTSADTDTIAACC